MKNSKSGFIGEYRINHSINTPSPISDYDYDPSREGRRFYSTYSHKLAIFDRYTDMELVSINFSSFTCAEILSSLYKMYATHAWVHITVQGEYLSNNPNTPVSMTFTTSNDGINDMIISIYSSGSVIGTFKIPNIKNFIDILEFDEIEDMFIL